MLGWYVRRFLAWIPANGARRRRPSIETVVMFIPTSVAKRIAMGVATETSIKAGLLMTKTTFRALDRSSTGFTNTSSWESTPCGSRKTGLALLGDGCAVALVPVPWMSSRMRSGLKPMEKSTVVRATLSVRD